MDYAGLITNIGKWINRTNGEIDDVIAEQIVESQYELEKRVPMWFLIDEYTHPISDGSTSTLIPNHIIRILDMEIEDSSGIRYPIMMVHTDRLRDLYPSNNATLPDTGRPEMATILGHIVKFGPQADDDYTLHITAHHHLDPLTLTTNTSNTWTTTYLAALRFQVLIDLEAYIGDDPRIAVWKERLKDILADMEGEARDTANVGRREAISEPEDLY